MTINKKEELKELMKEVNKELFEKANEASEIQKEELANLKETNTELKNKIEALENAPAKKVDLIVPGTDNKTVEVMYKKRYVPNQGISLKLYHTPEKQNVLAKSYIDFVSDILNQGQGSLRKAMNETTDTAGGHLVFDEYVNELLAFARESSFALQRCRVIDVGSDVINIPSEDGAVSVAWKAEGVAATESNPTVGNVKFEPERLTAYSTASNELLEDSEFDIVSWLTDLFAEAIGQELDNQVINGASSASSPFDGILVNADVVDSTGYLDISHIADVMTKMKANRSNNAMFLFHRLIYKEIITMTDGDGRYLFPPTVATPNSLYQIPIVLSEKMPATLNDLDKVGIYGNLKNYIIARRKQAGSMDIDIYGKFLEYQTRFRTVSRWHGKPWSGDAFVKMIY